MLKKGDKFFCSEVSTLYEITDILQEFVYYKIIGEQREHRIYRTIFENAIANGQIVIEGEDKSCMTLIN